MLKSYISTGIYINSCLNGLQQDVTGYYVYTGFFDQSDSNSKAYCLAIDNAAYLRSLHPCLPDPTTTSTSTTSTPTTLPPVILLASGNSPFNWTGDFNGESNAYYDIVAWGGTNGYLSGNKYNTNQYFSYVDANDIGGLGVVLAIINGSGLVTGFGRNDYAQLQIPDNLTGIIQVAVGYDHVVILRNNGTISGWGRDNWNALNINSQLSNVRKVCAGIGSTVVLLNNGIITGTNIIGGGIPIVYPVNSGYLNISHSYNHVLAVTSGGLITGFGINNFGENNTRDLNGVSKIYAGLSTSMAIYNNGYVTGYGTNQALYNTPYVSSSGVDIKLKGHIGTILKIDENIEQWVYPWINESGNITSKPTYLQNNIVAISQGVNFTAAIFKRLNTGLNSNILTGFNCLWKVTYVGGVDSYGGISLDDLYPPSGIVTQNCDGYSFSLPSITGSNQGYIQPNIPNCSDYGGTHEIDFISVCYSPLLNINYTKLGYAPKTGFAATGITTGDYWNSFLHTERANKVLKYSDNSNSTISGGWISIGTGSGANLIHSDNMYATFISGISGNFGTAFNYFTPGNYIAYLYGHGINSGDKSIFNFTKNGFTVLNSGTYTGVGYNSNIFSGGNQYIPVNFTINNPNDLVLILSSGYLNGVQFIKI